MKKINSRFRFLKLVLAIVTLVSFSVEAKTKNVTKKAPSAVKVVSAEPSSSITEINFSPDSRIQIDGDSTMRKFSAASKAVDLKGKALIKPEVASGLPWTPTEVEMDLIVQSLKSGESLLDDHMHENLKSEKFPKIQMKLTNFSFSKDGGNSVKATGQLTVAGVTKPLELKALLTAEGENLRIKGTKKVMMSDFGIEPPTMMMGTLKTRDEIEISFDVICLINNNKKG